MCIVILVIPSPPEFARKGFKRNTPNTFVKYEKNARKQTVSHFSESGKKVAFFVLSVIFLFKNVDTVYRQSFGNFQKVATIGGFYLIFGFILTFYSILSGSLHNVSTSTPRRGSQSSITSPFSDTPRPAPKRQPATPTTARLGSAPPRRPSGTSSSLMKGINLILCIN